MINVIRVFSIRDSLIRQQRVHTGEKPFPCEQCGEIYSERPNLIKDQVRFYKKIAQFKKYPPKSIILI